MQRGHGAGVPLGTEVPGTASGTGPAWAGGAGWHRALIYSSRALSLALELKCVVV